ncbi:hypothetical protein Pan153_30230 [Gimesia panareensis]|uniref:HEAT repeat protein n=1 Tax=Gimesia panareensis TaxID=2527978 RepID=A0A518FPU7_9PLAN|nr:HEAT repeat domain-containing protein [Gimesia panareensis]QDV18366.1 hypothetical protein Pan153_30230 [Gimesia panareensis]
MKFSDIPFPDAPDGSRDPELWMLLTQYEFVRWLPDDWPDEYREITSRLKQKTDRLTAAALDESEPLFRSRAACFLMALWRESRLDLILKFLDDEHEFVREQVARHLVSIRHPQLEGRLVELATLDAAADVRCAGCRGLGGQEPLSVIPTLIHILDQDHESGENGWSVSSCAADALDEMLGTEWMARRQEGVCSLPEGSPNPAAVREQALFYLQELQERQPDEKNSDRQSDSETD